MADSAPPYHQPVAPIIPHVPVVAPQLLAQAGQAGLQAFVSMAQARQRATLEREKMLQDTAMTMDAHQIQREANDRRFDLESESNELRRTNMLLDYDVQSERIGIEKQLLPLQADARRWTAFAAANRAGVLAQTAAKNAATQADFDARFAGYGLDSPNPDPVIFYSNARKLKDEFQFSNLPGIKNTLKQLDMRVQQQTIPIAQPERFVDDSGEVRTKHVTKRVPVGQVVENLLDPTKSEATWQLLEQSGYVRAVTKKGEGAPDPSKLGTISKLTNAIGLTNTPAPKGDKVEKHLDPQLERLKKTHAETDFSRSNPRTAPSGGPAAELPEEAQPQFQPTEADALIASYKRHIGNPNFDREKAKAFLAEKGIDVSELE